jgi:hypothetical protein
MGHFIFIILHLMAVLFGIVGLVITIPLHLIYAAVNKPNKKNELEELNAKWKAIEAKRPKAVRSGKRAMTGQEAWTEIKANPGVYFQSLGTVVVVGVVAYYFFIA